MPLITCLRTGWLTALTLLQNFWQDFKSGQKYYTGKDLKVHVTLKDILMGFNVKMCQQNIDHHVLHSKVNLYQEKLV